jgi:hypothetical protein
MACQHPRPPAGIVAMTGLQWILLATGAMSRPGGAAATWAAVKG